ncbi:MAG: glycosyltransferase family 2 protein, partial [Flavipsychrobacter sp.]
MTSNAPLVSVLMTSYCREKYIANAIESVLASTYVNFELIIVDDGSTDKTVEIAQSYAAKDKRIKFFVNEKNLGDYPNRNRAASLASGKYLKYVDSDDYIYPHGLQVLVSMMEANPEAGWGLCSLIQDIRQPFPLLLSPKEAYEYNYDGPGL